MPSLLPAVPFHTRVPASARKGSGRASDGLSVAQRRGVVGVIAVAHVAALWAVLQVPAVRAAVMEAAPVFVDLLAPPAPPSPPPPPPQVIKPLVKTPPTLVTARPAETPVAFEAPPEPERPPPPEPVMPVAIQAPPAPPAPPPPPRIIPASEVQYAVRPAPEYPRLSVRQGEAGLVIVRVYIDEAGMPRDVQLELSSGFVRLDESALAAVRKARFKPPTHAGVPISGWARIPIPFELEK